MRRTYRIVLKGASEYMICEGTEDIDGELLSLEDDPVTMIAYSEDDIREMVSDMYHEVSHADVYKPSKLKYDDEDEEFYYDDGDDRTPVDEIFRS